VDSANNRIWQNLRATRAHPPGRAASGDERASVYRAALEQFDELMRAAAAVGPSARPLPLFYAVSQSGRAIAAARGDVFQLRSHGLGMNRDETADLLERLVDPVPNTKRPDSFGHVARAIGSAALSAPVAIGELWAANPDLRLTPPPNLAATWLPALYVVPEEPDVPGFAYTLSADVRTQVHGLPPFVAEDESEEYIAEVLEACPGAEGFRLTEPPLLVDRGDFGWSTRVLWKADGTSSRDRRRKLDDIAPEHRFTDGRWLVPRVGKGADALSPFMLWWALLFALSNLARYDPNVWMDALALNSSPLAVPLAAILDDALDAVPHLVLDALRDERHLLPRVVWSLS
jgi:YaaC-like protein